MISREDWAAYNGAVEAIASGAAGQVERAVLGWCRAHPGASVAECREAAKAVMEAVAGTYDEAAAALAAEWYDAQAAGAGARLEAAVTSSVYAPEKADAVARYQARKLAEGDVAGFARRCGEYARNDALRSVNETIIENVGRDGAGGARFARVTTGAETCAFCIMLAGRGAVYRTRESAGEFRHFHRRCDCKVVPSFGGDPMATLVEGHDPWLEHRRWLRIKAARDGAVGLPSVRDRRNIEAGYAAALRLYRDSGKTPDGYDRTVGRFVESVVPENPIHVESGTMLRAKEIEGAAILAKLGRSVTLRNADTKMPGENTSDALVDGFLCDFKEIVSSKMKRMTKEIVGKLDRQGPAFLIDIRASAIKREEAEAKMSLLLEDPAIERFFLVSKDCVEELKK